MRGGEIMYNYIRGQWVMALVSDEWVMNKVPKFITAEQCAVILATPQTPGTLSVTV